MSKTNTFQASLTLTKEAPPNQAQPMVNTPQIKKIENLVLASRVINLTVLSTSPTVNNTTNAPQPNVSSNNTNPRLTTTSSNITPTPTNSSVATNSSVTTNSSQINTAPTNAAPLSSPKVNTTQTNTAQTNTAQVATSPNTKHIATVTDGKTEFPIISQTELKRGDVVRVLVDGNNNVQVLPNKNNNLATSTQVEALKQSLPKQLSTNDMSQLIKQLHVINESSSSTLPSQTQQALKQLMQSLPSLASLTTSPDTMKQAIQTSGMFSESLLLNNNKTELLPVDLKLNLNRLKETQENIGSLRLGSIPTEQIANAIERITTTQLRHFSDPNQAATPNYPLHIELPIRDGLRHNLVQIKIDKDPNTQENNQQERRWLVKLKFDFEETGRFEARTSIQANKVSIIFVAEDKETLQKLQKNIPTLKQQLRDKDIEVEKLDTFQAKLGKDETSSPLQNKQLIDVRT